MDLPPDDDPRRLEVRAWLEAHPDPSPADLVDAGFVTAHWPEPWGLDAEPELQLILAVAPGRRPAVAVVAPVPARRGRHHEHRQDHHNAPTHPCSPRFGDGRHRARGAL